MIMENLIKNLKELGYELVYDESMEGWRVVDYIAGINDYLPSSFSEVVFKHGFIFSCGVTLGGQGLCVCFHKL